MLYDLLRDIVLYIKNLWCIFKVRRKAGVDVHYTARLGKVLFEGGNHVSPHAQFSGHLGYGSYIGHYSVINATVGRYCSIGQFVQCNMGRHTYTAPFVSTSPCFVSTKKQAGFTYCTEDLYNENSGPIIIGNDCWIGQRVFIAGGVTVGDGAVVLAHAAVVKDVPPYAIVGGVPAKVISFRYDKETIDFLLNFKWWEKSPDWLRSHQKEMVNIELLKRI